MTILQELNLLHDRIDASKSIGSIEREPAAHPRSERDIYRRKHARRLLVGDLAIICSSVAVGQLIRLSAEHDHAAHAAGSWLFVDGNLFAVVLAAVWFGLLSLGSRSPRYTERGIDEYVLLSMATIQVFGVVAITALLFRWEISRGLLAIALPLGLICLVLSRWGWRRLDAHNRRNGNRTPVLVVGGRSAAQDIATEFAKDPWAGYDVVGVCVPGPIGGETVSVDGQDIPVVGEDIAVIDAVQRTGVQAVALAATHHLRPTEIRRLMWELDALGVDMLVAPGLIDITEQRLWSRPVSGLAVFEVARPQYSKANSMVKRLFDIVFAGTALLVLAPVMAVAAIAVKLSSPGPVFYCSERIGLDGKPFRMTKFRSMYTGADAAAASLLAASGQNAMFFKLKDDPRVTRVGSVLRRYSIDELPQFIDVLRGDMSIVGPRPQVRREVATYDDLVRRRLSVKPGVTGLWQVSGRSDLSPEDAIRLDLSYVENWSPMTDFVIIAKTARAVLHSEGAY